MKLSFTLAFALALPTPSLFAGDTDGTIPASFLGDWGTSLADCGTDADTTSLHIEHEHVRYGGHGEGGGPIRAVVVHGTDEMALIAELSNDGETWLAASTFRLSPDGNQLTEYSRTRDELLIRIRCDAIMGLRPDPALAPSHGVRSA